MKQQTRKAPSQNEIQQKNGMNEKRLVEEAQQMLNLPQEAMEHAEKKEQEIKWHIKEGESAQATQKPKGRRRSLKQAEAQKGSQLETIVKDYGDLFTSLGQH